MANPEHLAFLAHGVATWNAARREATSGLPDLSGADLSGRLLAGIDFGDADLRDADLRGCDLDGADLSGAWLERANLAGARLVGTRLAGARMARCRLDGAVLADGVPPEGDPQALAALLRGADAWRAWRQEHPGAEPELPQDAARAKLLRTQRAIEAAAATTPFEGDAEQLALLCSGVEPWNAYRTRNPDLRPDLRGADLSDRGLADADLSDADLRGARLVRADLRSARFIGANLHQALLCWADLRGANLLFGILVEADLTGADLTGATLSHAQCARGNFTGACLGDTALDGARLGEADFFEGDARQLARLYSTSWDAAEWNAWRQCEPALRPDLRGANLIRFRLGDAELVGADLARAQLAHANGYRARLAGADLTGAQAEGCDLMSADLEDANLALAAFVRADLRSARMSRASLLGTDLREARLQSAILAGAQLSRARLIEADLGGADLSGADLADACLYRATLSRATLRDADLTDAMLTQASMIETVLDGAVLTGAHVYGVSAWGLDLSRVCDQSGLRIAPDSRDVLTVDNLELAQFVYLMVHNEKIRGVIDTIGRKAVLLLGRFTATRKAVLDALKARLRELDLVPIVFDWDQPASRDLTETVALLAGMSRFVIADITDAKSIPQELSAIVPQLPSVPVQPIVLRGDPGYAMFEHWKGYRTMLRLFEYHDLAHLIEHVRPAILDPVEAWEAGESAQAGLEHQLAAKDAEIAELRARLASAAAPAQSRQ